MKTMLAARREHTRARGIGLKEIVIPKLEAGEVRVKVEYCGLCGSDLHVWRGDAGYDWVASGRIMGHEIVGTVVARSEDLSTSIGPQVGSRVVVIAQSGCGNCHACVHETANGCAEKLTVGLSRDGGASEYLSVPARQTLPVPENVSALDAVLTEPLSVAARAVIARGKVRAGDVVAISGPGTIGILTALVCQHLGAEVYLLGTERDLDMRGDLASALGLTLTQRLDEDIKPKLWFETSGAQPALDLALTRLPVGARLVLLALYATPPRWDANLAVRKELDIIASYSSHGPDYSAALEILAANPGLGERFVQIHPLTDVTAAFESIGKTVAPKIAVAP